MNTKYVNQQNYNPNTNKVSWTSKREEPEKYGLTKKSVEKKTVPGMAVSIKQIMARYETGRQKPEEVAD